MSARRRLIMIMIDGISADYFADHRARLPHLSALAERGTVVARMPAAVPGTSMPGRASIVTGVGTETHGIFGNHIFDGTTFRCAMPEDVRVPTIAGVAREAGLDVACLGYATINPDDTALYLPPWWLRGWMDGSRFSKVYAGPQQADTVKDPDGRLAALEPALSPPISATTAAQGNGSGGLVAGLAGDLRAMQAVAGLACSATPPDLILTEIAMTDQVQHQHGYGVAAAHWSLASADALVGSLIQQLDRCGRLADTVIAVTSDHGHSPIETAIHPDVVIPDALWQTEGATLQVALINGTSRDDIATRLAEVGARAHDSAHVPADRRNEVAIFTAPPRHSFEPRAPDAPPDRPTGPAFYVSSHGLRPGSPEDDRFCIFTGPGVPAAAVDRADAVDFAPTLAALLGLAMPTAQGRPIVTSG